MSSLIFYIKCFFQQLSGNASSLEPDVNGLRDLAANAAKALSTGDPAAAQAAAVEANAQAESAILAYNALCTTLSETQVKLASAAQLLPQFKENGGKITAGITATEKELEAAEMKDSSDVKKTADETGREEERLKVRLFSFFK